MATEKIEPKDFSGLRVIEARVVPWDHEFGVAVKYEGGKHQAYRIGDKEAAEIEARRLNALPA